MKKIVYIISNIEKALAFEWLAEHLDNNKFELTFILLNKDETSLERSLRKHCAVQRINFNGKSDVFGAFFKVLKTLKHLRPEVLHCHMRMAKFIGLSAGLITRIPKRIYTRHSATFNLVYHPHAVKYDKMMNRIATDIIAISENVKTALLNEGVKNQKISLVRHGFDLESFKLVPSERVNEILTKYQIPNQGLKVGVISRLLELKGVQYIVPAVTELVKSGMDIHLILANARGNYQPQIQELLSELPETSYTLIPFEEDLQALYQTFDLFIHTPVSDHIEAFGQTYVEALIAEVPSIFTLSGVAPEFIQHEHNALVVPFKDTESIRLSIERLAQDNELCDHLKTNGLKSVRQFDIEGFVANLERLYDV